MANKNFEAYRQYESTREGIENEILSYFLNRVKKNEQEIKELIEINKEEVNYEEIIKIIESEKEKSIEYKKYSYWVITPSNFMHAVVTMPIGVIGVETSKTQNAIKYWLKAITTHNAVVVIDKEYDEFDVKQYILNILQIALNKYELPENLIERIPYEESIDENYQKIIRVDEEEIENQKDKIQNKEKAKEEIVYLEDIKLEKEAENDKEPNQEIWKGEYEEILKRINEKEYQAVSVYTQSPQIAYQAINEIESPIIFINTSLKNKKHIKEAENKLEGIEKELYRIKNIIFPYQNNVNANNMEINNLNQKEDIEEIKIEEEEANEEKSMIKYEKEVKILEKIKALLNKILKK